MTFRRLLAFVQRDMKMSHIYQPGMIRTLLDHGGEADATTIARALLQYDQGQIDYYTLIVKRMVGRVLIGRDVVARTGWTYCLRGYEKLAPDEIDAIKQECERKIAAFLQKRGTALFRTRGRPLGYISGTVRYEVLKAAKFRCELCGVSADECALEVDHIVPRSKGGSDEMTNLQALCYVCNAMKGNRDNTNFDAVRASYGVREQGCPFCQTVGRGIVVDNELAYAVWDRFPVATGHLLVIPKRHVADYFDLGIPEVRACQLLLGQARTLIMQKYPDVTGFNVGVNVGADAGQTVMHCHIHLIPRREGDNPEPRGGVRAVILGKAVY